MAEFALFLTETAMVDELVNPQLAAIGSVDLVLRAQGTNRLGQTVRGP